MVWGQVQGPAGLVRAGRWHTKFLQNLWEFDVHERLCLVTRPAESGQRDGLRQAADRRWVSGGLLLEAQTEGTFC